MKKRLVEDHPTREKTSGFIGELENLRFNLKVKLQKAPPCRFGIDDLLGRPNNLPPPQLFMSGCIPIVIV